MVNATDETRTEKGMSLSRGPALVLGTILLAAGLYFLYRQHTFQHFSNFPNGKAPVDGKVLFGIFGANGWTGMLTAVAGGLLLFGAAQHVLAKAMSLIVGVALGAAAIIAFVSGNVLGMAAANTWTKLAWAIAAAILLFNTLLPRRRRTVVATGDGGRTMTDRGGRHSRRHEVEAAGAGAAAGAYAEHRHDRHVAERDAEGRGAAGDRAVAGDRGRDEDATVGHDHGRGEDATVAHDRASSEDATVAHDRTGGATARDGEAAPEQGSAPVRAGRED